MRDRSRRAPRRASPGFVVRDRCRAERLADERRCNELFAAGQNRGGTETQARTVGAIAERAETLRAAEPRLACPLSRHVFPLRQKHCQALARAACFQKLAHRELMAAVTAVVE